VSPLFIHRISREPPVWDESTPEVRSPFSSPGYLSLVNQAYRAQTAWVTTYQGGVPIFTSPYTLARRFGFSVWGSPFQGSFSPYQDGFLLSGEADPATRWALRKQEVVFLSQIKGSLEVRNIPRPNYDWPAQPEEVTVPGAKPIQTFIKTIPANREKAWSEFGSKNRNMVRKAEKEGLVIETRRGDPCLLEESYRILAEAFARRQTKPSHPRSFFVRLIQSMEEWGQGKCFYAFAGPTLLAMGAFFFDAGTMYYVSGGHRHLAASAGASHGIQWAAIQAAVERGCRWYDLGGAGRESIDSFKKNLGGIPFQYPALGWTRPWFAKFKRWLLPMYLRWRRGGQ